MTLNEASVPPVTSQNWQGERNRSHGHENFRPRGYGLDDLIWAQSPAGDSARSLSLSTTTSAADDESTDAGYEKTTGKPPIQPLNKVVFSSLSNDVPRLPPLAGSVTFQKPNHRPVVYLDGTAGGSSSCGQRLDQYDHCRRGSATLLSSPDRDIDLAWQHRWRQRQQGQSQVLPPVYTTMRPKAIPSSPTSLSPNTIRDDRLLNVNPGYGTSAEPSSSYRSNERLSLCSPNNGSISALSEACLPYTQPSSHLSHQKREIALPPLATVQQYTPPRLERRESASLYAANYPLKQGSINTTGTVAIIPTESSSGADNFQSPTNALPPLLKHLEDSCLTGTGLQQSPSWSQLLPRFSQLPPISQSHYSSSSLPEELYRSRYSASPASSIEYGDDSAGFALSKHLTSASFSSNDGRRYSWPDFGGDASAPESTFTASGPADYSAASPQDLPPSRVTSPFPGPYIFLPPLPGYHESSAPRQLPTTPLTMQSPLDGETVEVREMRQSLPSFYRIPQGMYRCQVHGCTAPPFQTQYLLNSHANVHSSDRPFYCPEPGCPRSKDGKGFKRKNEMIRHGLVHRSPGYACPFCVDREHKYPRPDNLLRYESSYHPVFDPYSLPALTLSLDMFTCTTRSEAEMTNCCVKSWHNEQMGQVGVVVGASRRK